MVHMEAPQLLNSTAQSAHRRLRFMTRKKLTKRQLTKVEQLRCTNLVEHMPHCIALPAVLQSRAWYSCKRLQWRIWPQLQAVVVSLQRAVPHQRLRASQSVRQLASSRSKRTWRVYRLRQWHQRWLALAVAACRCLWKQQLWLGIKVITSECSQACCVCGHRCVRPASDCLLKPSHSAQITTSRLSLMHLCLCRCDCHPPSRCDPAMTSMMMMALR
jgi:hypothetical protein